MTEHENKHQQIMHYSGTKFSNGSGKGKLSVILILGLFV